MRYGVVVLGAVAAILVGELAVSVASDLIPEPSVWPTVETDVKASQIPRVSPPPEVVFLGSSAMEAGADPGIMSTLIGGSVVYNSALPFSSPASDLIWFSDVIPSSWSKALYVIGFPPLPFEPSTALLTAGLETAVESDQPWVQFSQLAAKRGVFADWDRLQARSRLKDLGLWTELGHQTGYYGRSLEDDIPRDELKRGSDLPVDQERALRALVSELEARGGQVMIVVEPFRLGASDSDDSSAYRALVASLAENLRVPIIDAQTESWRSELWADDFHFNRAGTEAFTSYLASHISSILEESQG